MSYLFVSFSVKPNVTINRYFLDVLSLTVDYNPKIHCEAKILFSYYSLTFQLANKTLRSF